MCGINGLVNFRSGNKLVEAMNERLHHRGPDASGVFSHNNTNLGHTRLSIIDLSSHANQPFLSDDENYAMVYNGEVYNYQEIKIKYDLNCRTSSDTEVILKAFIKVGPAIFDELNGMFAVAIYNKQTDELLIARDKIGIKPLFYYLSENKNSNSFAFASELNALKAVPEVAKNLTINHESVTAFLHLGYIPGPLSIYNQIQKFPSGSYAKFKKGKLEFHEYWNGAKKVKPTILSDEKEATLELDRLLNDSIRLRLQSDVPFGTFLSGGIDSSLVTAIAQKQNKKYNNEKINSFSIGFQEKSKNEAEFAKAVADQIGTKHHEFIVKEQNAMDLLPSMFSAYGEPYADSSAIPTLLVSELARKEVKMTLSGDGGDELFHGYGFYNWAQRLNKPLVQTFKKPIASALKQGNNRMKRAAELFSFQKQELKSHIFSQEQYYFSIAEIQDLLVEKVTLPTFINSEATVSRKLTAAEKQSLFDIQFYLKDELLVKVDVATMQNSLEDRVPLLDSRIVEFALNLDPSLKVKGKNQKYLLKKVLYNYLPASLFDRPKQGFSIPLLQWLKGDLKYLIEDHLNKPSVEAVGLVKWESVQAILSRFNHGETYLYTRIWSLIVLHQWMKSNPI